MESKYRNNLMCAVFMRNCNEALRLINSGSDLHGGERMLLKCCQADCMEPVAIRLLELGIKPNYLDVHNEETPLLASISRSTLCLFDKLIAAGADTEQCINTDNDTALMVACEFPDLSNACIKLIEAGANVEHKNKRGDTPLSNARRRGQPQRVIMKIIRRLFINACEKGDYDGVCNILSTDSSILDDLSAPLVVACERGHSDIAVLLISHGARRDTEKALLSLCEKETMTEKAALALLDICFELRPAEKSRLFIEFHQRNMHTAARRIELLLSQD